MTHPLFHADSTVFISGQSGPDSNCDLETNVQESSGDLQLNLTRTGNLDQVVRVVCYTQDDSAHGKADYLSRPKNSLESEVIFGVNETTAVCAVTIVNDQVFESRERFYVRLGNTRQGFAHIEPTLSTMCVHINYDESDSK